MRIILFAFAALFAATPLIASETAEYGAGPSVRRRLNKGDAKTALAVRGGDVDHR